MKYCNSILSIINIIQFFACSQNDNIVAPTEDDFLKAKLVGRWGGEINSTYVQYYYDNNAFIDSLYNLSDIKKLQYVVTGKYSINKSILTYSDLKCTFADTINISSNVIQDGLIFYPAKIEYSESKLKFTSVEIFSQDEGNMNQLKGKWDSRVWTVGIERRPFFKIYQGTINNSYFFNSDSLIYKLATTNSLGSTLLGLFGTDSGTYNYSPPHLELNSFYFTFHFYTTDISFQNNKMYWYYDWVGYSVNSMNKIEKNSGRLSYIRKNFAPFPIIRTEYIKN